MLLDLKGELSKQITFSARLGGRIESEEIRSRFLHGRESEFHPLLMNDPVPVPYLRLIRPLTGVYGPRR